MDKKKKGKYFLIGAIAAAAGAAAYKLLNASKTCHDAEEPDEEETDLCCDECLLDDLDAADETEAVDEAEDEAEDEEESGAEAEEYADEENAEAEESDDADAE